MTARLAERTAAQFIAWVERVATEGMPVERRARALAAARVALCLEVVRRLDAERAHIVQELRAQHARWRSIGKALDRWSDLAERAAPTYARHRDAGLRHDDPDVIGCSSACPACRAERWIP